MGETPVFFDMVPQRSLVSTCRKSVTIPTSGLEKRHVTVVLTAAADGFILPPILIFRGKANLTIKYIIVAPESFVTVTQEKAWMNESLMFTQFEKVWKTYAKEKQKELRFDRPFMVYDAFKAHKTDNVKVLLAKNNTNLALVAASCTSKCQPLDMYINKSFKGALSNFWKGYVASIVTNLTETEKQRESFKLTSPSRQDIVNWILEGINYL